MRALQIRARFLDLGGIAPILSVLEIPLSHRDRFLILAYLPLRLGVRNT
jgi:hypothetical protein